MGRSDEKWPQWKRGKERGKGSWFNSFGAVVPVKVGRELELFDGWMRRGAREVGGALVSKREMVLGEALAQRIVVRVIT
jgi:hypothetical protein